MKVKSLENPFPNEIPPEDKVDEFSKFSKIKYRQPKVINLVP